MFKRKKQIEELEEAMYQLEQRFKRVDERHTAFVMDINTQISLHRQSLTGLSERVNDEIQFMSSKIKSRDKKVIVEKRGRKQKLK